MPAPSAPTNFAAAPSALGVLLTWDTEASIDGFDLYRSTAADHSGEVLLALVDDSILSYLDLAATPGTHYYYRLDASSNVDGASSKVAADAVAGLGMTITEARAWVTQALRSGGSTAQYDPTDKDRGIITICEQFARVTRCMQVAGTVALAADSAVADCSGLTRFRPERILSAHLTTVAGELERPGYQEVHRRQIECTATGKPRRIAFETTTATSGIVHPTPDAVYSLRLKWWEPMVAYTPGTASPDTITINIPRDYLPQILGFGAPAVIQANHPSMGYASENYKKYLAYEASMAGAGNEGANVLIRPSLRELERRRWE